MNSTGNACRSFGELGNDFRVLASEYRRVSRRVTGVAAYCEKAEVQRDQVLEIAFTHVVAYIDDAAELLDQVAERVANCADGEAANEVACAANCAADETVNGVEPSNAGSGTPIKTLGDASAALRSAAVDLEGAMNRALDLVDEVGNGELVGDSHPYGHIVQGICIPYLLLASASLEQ